MDGGERATICSSSMVKSCRRLMEPGRKIIFWVRGISSGKRFRTDYLAHRLLERSWRERDGRSIAFTLTRPFRLRARFARRSSTGTRTIAEIASTRLLTGTKRSRMRLSRFFHLLTQGCRAPIRPPQPNSDFYWLGNSQRGGGGEAFFEPSEDHAGADAVADAFARHYGEGHFVFLFARGVELFDGFLVRDLDGDSFEDDNVIAGLEVHRHFRIMFEVASFCGKCARCQNTAPLRTRNPKPEWNGGLHRDAPYRSNNCASAPGVVRRGSRAGNACVASYRKAWASAGRPQRVGREDPTIAIVWLGALISATSIPPRGTSAPRRCVCALLLPHP